MLEMSLSRNNHHLLRPLLCASVLDSSSSGIKSIEEMSGGSQLKPILATLNTSQRSALEHCMTSALTPSADAGFFLIQGPPGTGKSTTLYKLINIIHCLSISNRRTEVLKAIETSTSINKQFLESEIFSRWRFNILVATPSNGAIDHLCG